MPSSRAATLTPSPKISLSSMMMSPTLMPMRSWIGLASASGYVNCFACRNDAAIEALERVTRLSPLDPLGHLVKFGFALAHLQSGRYKQAIEWADRTLVQKPGFINAMVVRTAACGHLDLREEGREWVGRLREIAPQLTVGSIKDFLSGFFVPDSLAYQVDGLAKAGLPEE